jgi:hypothetical protein
MVGREHPMPTGTLDLDVVLAEDDELTARIGAALLMHKTLPHPSLRLLEDLHPREVARARFHALWAERASGSPDPLAVARHFKAQLVHFFTLKGKLIEPSTITLDS